MSLYNRYSTNQNLEKTGVIMDIGDARIRLARAGGANEKYVKRMEVLTKPHRRAIQSGNVDRDTVMNISLQVYAETVIVDWETKTQTGDWLQGIEDTDGNILPFNVENVVTTLKALPDLFLDIQTFASDNNMYLQSILEEDSKN